MILNLFDKHLLFFQRAELLNPGGFGIVDELDHP